MYNRKAVLFFRSMPTTENYRSADFVTYGILFALHLANQKQK